MAIGNVSQVMAKAGATALRDMRSEARKRIKLRKAIKASKIGKVLKLSRPTSKVVPGINSEWRLDVLGGVTRVSDYSYRKTREGVAVTINRGQKSLIRSAFVATMKSGHKGVFVRRGPARLPILEPLASRPVDALLHPGEAEGVADRGARSFRATFERLGGDARVLLAGLTRRIE